MKENIYWMKFEVLKPFMVDVFKGMGVPEDEAEICAEVLIEADRRGIDSHGVGRLKTIYYNRVMKDKIQSARTDLKVLKDRKATAMVDGNQGMGMVIAHRCMEMAIEKARTYGVGVVTARNSTHYGIAAYYPMMAAREGMIGMTATNARPSIAPTFGVENMLGTNPLVFAMPTDEEFPFTNDYATSISQRGKIETYARNGKDLPPGWVIGRDGKTKTNAKEVLDDLTHNRAALAPLGGIGEETAGYKGYGFSTVVEILAASLQQGDFLKRLSGTDENGQKGPIRLGHFFMAVDIESFTDLEKFKKTTGDILRELRASAKAPGEKRIYTCGEKEYLAWLERKDKGAPLGEVLQKELITMRDELALSRYKFEFE